ncbi:MULTISPECIES: site-2 protease family protein [Chromobacteriaceae]|uniref:Site-2 protease family protein n=3 Tax=Chromobacteriaceae TaxID=1499392 RepID=A0ABV0F9G9_9NEIS|nr:MULTISPECIES: site-2 protease family protein [Chromobacteriaceae]MBX9298609.1 site-2 protease family protein [Chromobacterium vaccinii]ERE06347.1 peptidase M50 [Pseudogulbenkiania ferrooxidans EGD-HP2]MBX9348023.1 site-2 protease family protein [Chromobacterium vaccinii]MBX9357514.1 site-2 protease family protein [Chromobacterium vaccinii]MCD4505687.1 site-2 protease family protein [Chromobacterium piscinae]
MFDPNQLVQQVTIYALPVLLAITLHEAAHAYAARRFGDDTAYLQGRMTLNPFKHIDPIGTVLLPLLTIWLGSFVFGWAKPVPVNFNALRKPRQNMRWVAAAGPLANLAMMLAWVALLKLALGMDGAYRDPLMLMSKAGISINISLMLLNLLPILPLDGGRIVYSLLPPGIAWRYAQTETWGMWLLLILVASGLLGVILQPLYVLMYHLLQLFF